MPRSPLRAIVLGTLLIPINCYWLVISRQPYQYQPIPTIISPFFNVIFILLLLVLGNRLLARLSPRLALRQRELIVIYVMLSVTSAIQSFQMMQTLTTMMEVPFRRATVENDWKNLFGRYIPTWLSVSDKKAIAAYYPGDSTLSTASPQLVKTFLVVGRFRGDAGLRHALYRPLCACLLGGAGTLILSDYSTAPSYSQPTSIKPQCG